MGVKTDREDQVKLRDNAELTIPKLKIGQSLSGLSGSTHGLIIANGDGTLSRATVPNSYFVSLLCNADSDSSVCLGYNSSALGNQSSSFGALSQSGKDGDSATAIGYASNAAKLNSTAIGSRAFANGSNSLAIGVGSQAL